MIIVDELTVDEYQGIEAAGQLSIEKQVLSILTEFTLTHPSYEQFNTLITDKGCGEITYYQHVIEPPFDEIIESDLTVWTENDGFDNLSFTMDPLHVDWVDSEGIEFTFNP